MHNAVNRLLFDCIVVVTLTFRLFCHRLYGKRPKNDAANKNLEYPKTHVFPRKMNGTMNVYRSVCAYIIESPFDIVNLIEKLLIIFPGWNRNRKNGAYRIAHTTILINCNSPHRRMTNSIAYRSLFADSS